MASTGAVTFYMLGKQNEKMEQIHHQTNGTLSKLQGENQRLTQQLVEPALSSLSNRHATITA